MGRKFFVGGNWKINGTRESIDKIIEFLNYDDLDPNCGTEINFLWCWICLVLVCIHNLFTEVVVGVPAIYLDYCRKKFNSNFGVAAQNCYKSNKGPFTGARYHI